MRLRRLPAVSLEDNRASVVQAAESGLLAGAVTIQAQRIEAQHRIDQLDIELLDAEELQRELRAEVAVAESPERVMAEALALGMVEPGPVLPLVPPATDSAEPVDPAVTPPSTDSNQPVALGADPATSDEKAPAGGG